MADTVGSIGINLNLNSNNFTKQLGGISTKANKVASTISNTFTNSFRRASNSANSAAGSMSNSLAKIGKMVVAAFSVRAIARFGKECVDLGSNLAEVQNVVDVTFGTMSGKVDQFAKNAAANFGLSKTMAKKYTGLYGSMAEAFGFTEKEAYKMSTALTGLAGDVASFYNIEQDLAYTKLKSVFSGETETLKDLGIVMTQNVLDAYAMANGYGKLTKDMTEAEKVSLRFAFVQSQLANAQGDFVRTSNSWANQIRLLKLNFDSLKASLGQAFIQALTPIVKFLNTLILRLQTAADAFSRFMSQLFGTPIQSSAGAITENVTDATSGVETLADTSNDAADAIGKSEKAAKKLKKSLAGFDKLNVLQSTDTSGGGGGQSSGGAPTGGGATTPAIGGISPKVPKQLEAINPIIDRIRKGFGRVFDVFQKAWSNKGAGVINSITTAFENVKRLLGSIGHSFMTVFTNGTGQKSLESILGIFENIFSIVGNLAKAIQTAWNKAGTGTRIVQSVWNIFNKVLSTIKRITGATADWLSELDLSPLMTSIAGMMESLEPLANLLLDSFATAYETVLLPLASWTIEEAAPTAVDMLSEAFTALEAILNPIISGIQSLLTYMQPVFDWIGETAVQILGQFKNAFTQVGNVFKEKGADIQNIFQGIGQVIQKVWGFIQPIFNTVRTYIFGLFTTIVNFISGKIKAVIGYFSGIVDFISGVFTGDWSKAWKGIKKIFQSVWDGFVNIVKLPVNIIIGVIEGLVNGVSSAINMLIDAINTIQIDIPDWVPFVGGKKFGFNIPHIGEFHIPRLAEGGLIKAPTLALVGDNKNAQNDPEVVSPLSKLQGMIGNMGGYDTETVSLLTRILRVLENIYDKVYALSIDVKDREIVVSVAGREIFRAVRDENDKYISRYGHSALV